MGTICMEYTLFQYFAHLFRYDEGGKNGNLDIDEYQLFYDKCPFASCCRCRCERRYLETECDDD